MRIDDVRRLDLGTFVRPAEETGTGEPRVEAVYACAVRTAAGILLLDTGLGETDEETEAWYRPRRVPLPDALSTAGLTLADVALVARTTWRRLETSYRPGLWRFLMRIPRVLVPLFAIAIVPGAAAGGLVAAGLPASADAAAHEAAPPTQPTVVAVRAAHHNGVDRVVFEFRGGLPASHRARYVDRLIADGSGNTVRIAGRAILQVRFGNARAHTDSGASTAPGRTAYALPNVMTTVRSGDFEGVVAYGIGLAKRTTFHVSTLHSPARVVVAVRAAFRTEQRKVWFLDRTRFLANTPPFFVPRLRPVMPLTPATGLLDRLFAGPLPSERAGGLRLLRSAANGATIRSIRNGVARVQLAGGCSSRGSTVTIAGEITPTLRQLGTVDWVKIYSPTGHTEHPRGQRDSIPGCLEP